MARFSDLFSVTSALLNDTSSKKGSLVYLMHLNLLKDHFWCRDLGVSSALHVKRQLFHMVTHVFYNSNLSQETFAVET